MRNMLTASSTDSMNQGIGEIMTYKSTVELEKRFGVYKLDPRWSLESSSGEESDMCCGNTKPH